MNENYPSNAHKAWSVILKLKTCYFLHNFHIFAKFCLKLNPPMQLNPL